MEDNLKILKAEYLSSHWLDSTQILKNRSDDQSNFTEMSIEDDLQIL